MAQPATFTCSRRPGSPSSQGARPLKRSSESRVRNRISPIQMNSGRAVRVHDEEALQIVVALASPTGRSEERRVGQELFGTFRSGLTPSLQNTQYKETVTPYN